jgi:branched-chain amino acid transport system ATP-binding protein
MMLTVEQLSGGYGQGHVLDQLNFKLDTGCSIALLGANGAGKTTTLRAISGLLPHVMGSIRFREHSLEKYPAHQRAHLGIAHVPEGRKLFPDLTVHENLSLGAIRLKRPDLEVEQQVFDLFPRLKERTTQLAGTLSGGEQQMLAIGRALMSKPCLLMLDEPSMGLAPKLVTEVFDALAVLQEKGLTLLIVEQYAKKALSLCQYAYVLNRGRIVLEGKPDTIGDQLHEVYLN